MLGWCCVLQVRAWIVYHHGHISRNKYHTSKVYAETPQYSAREKELVATKDEKWLFTIYIEDETWA